MVTVPTIPQPPARTPHFLPHFLLYNHPVHRLISPGLQPSFPPSPYPFSLIWPKLCLSAVWSTILPSFLIYLLDCYWSPKDLLLLVVTEFPSFSWSGNYISQPSLLTMVTWLSYDSNMCDLKGVVMLSPHPFLLAGRQSHHGCQGAKWTRWTS